MCICAAAPFGLVYAPSRVLPKRLPTFVDSRFFRAEIGHTKRDTKADRSMNSFNFKRIFSALACASLFAAAPAHATLVVSSSVGGAPTGAIYANFDNLPLGNAGGTSTGIGVSFTGDAETVVGALGGRYAAPYISNNNGLPFGAANGADTTEYLSTGIGSVRLSLPSLAQYVGLLWGSVDGYNTLQLFNGQTLVGSVTGGDVTANANGDQGVNGTYYVNISSDIAFDSVVALSSQYAFEFDNVAYNPISVENHSPVPEPATLALFASALAAFGVFQTRQRRVAAVR